MANTSGHSKQNIIMDPKEANKCLNLAFVGIIAGNMMNTKWEWSSMAWEGRMEIGVISQTLGSQTKDYWTMKRRSWRHTDKQLHQTDLRTVSGGHITLVPRINVNIPISYGITGENKRH